MSFAFRRSRVTRLLLLGAIAASSIGISLARADTAHAGSTSCQTISVTTPGATYRVAGQSIRVPSVSNPTACVTSADVVTLAISRETNGICTTNCYTIYVGGVVDPGAVTITYYADGVPQTFRYDPAPVPLPGQCLLSIGSPRAPRPDCFSSLDVDYLPPPPTVDVQALVDQICAQLYGACATVEQYVRDKVTQLCGPGLICDPQYAVEYVVADVRWRLCRPNLPSNPVCDMLAT